MEDAHEYETKDFYSAAFLVANSHKLVRVNRADPRRVYFVFKDFDGRVDLLRDFLYGIGQVEPQAFIAAIKHLKGLIHCHD